MQVGRERFDPVNHQPTQIPKDMKIPISTSIDSRELPLDQVCVKLSSTLCRSNDDSVAQSLCRSMAQILLK